MIVVIAILLFFVLSGMISINENLKVVAKNQIEIIKVLKNK